MTFLEGFAGLSGFAPPVALGMTRSRSPVGAAGAGPIATSTLVDNGATMSPLWQTAGWPLLLFALAVVAGGGAWGAAFAASSPVLGRVHEELLAVNETVYSNVQQFSLVPYTDNSDEYRDAVEGWYAHFKELCNLARQALHGPVEDAASRSLSFAMHSVPIAVAAGIVSSIWSFWQRRAGFLCAACLGYIAAAVVTMWSLVSLITSVNSGLAMILGDISGGTMQALLAQSNEDDEFLQLMLLTTGYLRRIDEAPPWLCLPLPPPLHRIRHPTLSSRPLGNAEATACVPVTYSTLRAAGAATGLWLLGILLLQSRPDEPWRKLDTVKKNS